MLDWIRRRGRASGPTMEGLFGALEEGGFTEGALRGVALAREEARHFGHSYVGTEHILLGILREDGGAAATVLEGSGVGLDEARASVEGVVGQDDGDPGPLEEPLAPRAKRVLRLARQEALRLDHDHVGPGHLLLGLVRDAEEGEGLGVAWAWPGRGRAGARGPGRGPPRGTTEGPARTRHRGVRPPPRDRDLDGRTT